MAFGAKLQQIDKAFPVGFRMSRSQFLQLLHEWNGTVVLAVEMDRSLRQNALPLLYNNIIVSILGCQWQYQLVSVRVRI